MPAFTRRHLLLASAAAPALPAAEPLRTVHSQPSWILENDHVEAAITRLGGHMAPVRFERRSSAPVQPYHVSPWQDERGVKIDAPVLAPLRGDFFCLPFGGGKEPGGREHPAHGESATAAWTFGDLARKGKVTTLTATLRTKVREGVLTKRVMLVDGHNAVYSDHVIDGFAGETTPGHHATLKLPRAQGKLRLATSAFAFATTHPAQFADPLKGEYQSFAIGAEIKDLRHVPLRFKDATAGVDMTALPPSPGYVDLMAVFKKPGGEPAWMTAVNQEEGYVWFSLKDAAVLPATVFWLENRGRHHSPWNGRNQCLGLEDVCWYFDQSHQDNPARRRGIPTNLRIERGKPVSIRYIQGAVKVPAGFDIVRTVEFGADSITLISSGGPRVTAPVAHGFLKSGVL